MFPSDLLLSFISFSDPPRIQSSVPSLERQIHSRQINEISSDAPNRTSTHDVLPLNRVRSDFETTFKLDTPITLSNRFPPKDDVTNNGNIASPESSSMISAKDSLEPPFDGKRTSIETIERISGNSGNLENRIRDVETLYLSYKTG